MMRFSAAFLELFFAGMVQRNAGGAACQK